VGTATVPRAAQGVFERARADTLVRWETQQLEAYTGAPSYLQKEECMLCTCIFCLVGGVQPASKAVWVGLG
jgi:hypothetical protein